MPYRLRDYQQELVDKTNEAVLQGLVPCLTAPTGSGETVMRQRGWQGWPWTAASVW